MSENNPAGGRKGDRVTRFPGSTFLAGDWAGGLKLKFHVLEDGTASARITLPDHYGGPPGIIHGGILGSLLDEAMTVATFEARVPGLTASMTLDYKVPVPRGSMVLVTGRVERVEGRKVYCAGEIRLEDGTLAVAGTALFVQHEAVVAFLKPFMDGDSDTT